MGVQQRRLDEPALGARGGLENKRNDAAQAMGAQDIFQRVSGM
jgi:hypothetical protein